MGGVGRNGQGQGEHPALGVGLVWVSQRWQVVDFLPLFASVGQSNEAETVEATWLAAPCVGSAASSRPATVHKPGVLAVAPVATDSAPANESPLATGGTGHKKPGAGSLEPEGNLKWDLERGRNGMARNRKDRGNPRWAGTRRGAPIVNGEHHVR